MKSYRFPAAITLGLLAWALLVGLCAGQEIKGPDKAEPYKLVRLSVEGDWDGAVWDAGEAADLQTSPDGKSVVFVGPPGAYRVRVVCVNFTSKKFGQAIKTVTIGEPSPNPQPGPEPLPKPLPGPQQLTVIVVEESSRRTSQQAATLFAPQVHALLQQRGHSWNLIEQDRAGSFADWATRAAGKFPTLFLVGKDGALVFEGPLPTSPAAFVETLKKYGG